MLSDSFFYCYTATFFCEDLLSIRLFFFFSLNVILWMNSMFWIRQLYRILSTFIINRRWQFNRSRKDLTGFLLFYLSASFHFQIWVAAPAFFLLSPLPPFPPAGVPGVFAFSVSSCRELLRFGFVSQWSPARVSKCPFYEKRRERERETQFRTIDP